VATDDQSSVDIYSQEYIDAANLELSERTCLNRDCPTRESGRVGTGKVTTRYSIVGESLVGHNAFPARLDLIYTCPVCEVEMRLHQ
jgi:hypothetical protein